MLTSRQEPLRLGVMDPVEARGLGGGCGGCPWQGVLYMICGWAEAKCGSERQEDPCWCRS